MKDQRIIAHPICLLITALLLCQHVHAQKGITVDSLVNQSIQLFDAQPDESFSLARKAYELALSKSDKKGIMDALNEIGSHYLVRGNFDSSIIIYEQGLELSRALGDQGKAAGILHNLGLIYDQQGKLDKALSNFRQALLINRKMNRKWMAFNLGAIGNVYLKLGNNAEALKHKYQALGISEQLGDDETVADEIGSIAMIHDDLKEYDKSRSLYFKALALYEKIGSQRGISNIYNSLSGLYLTTGRKDAAKHYGEEALKLNRELGDLYAISCSLHGLANICLATGDTTKALKYVQEAFDLAVKIGSERREAISATLLGEIYTRRRQYTLAKEYLTRALAIARPQGLLPELSAIYLDLSHLDSTQGNFSSAFENYKLYAVSRDSILNEKSIRSLTSQMMTHEFEKVQSGQKVEQDKKDAKALEELKRQKTIRNALLGGFGLTLVFSVIFLKQRNRINAEKKRSDELLVNILPREVADELKAKGAAEAKLFDEVTVLFTDFKDFTALSETLSPKTLVSDLHGYFTAFDNIMQAHRLEKIKTIGDAYMAAGGLPVPRTSHAKDVVNAALEILRFMEGEQVKKKAANQPYFEIRIGVHTGPVVAGIVGVKKFSYDIWGDTVNTASRMESSGEEGNVNISGVTYNLVKSDFLCTYRGKISAKGKGEIDMYFVEDRI